MERNLAMAYYDGTKLLSMKDLNGNEPEIYLCTTNRTGGKTTWFSKFLVKKFLEKKEKFCLVYRFNYELDDCAEKFFKDISSLFFQGHTMESKRRASGIFHELFIDDISCGYAIALNGADQLKKYSHLFNDVQRMFFDEFQSETNHYCPDEIRKFISVHVSIARGQGKQVRHVPVYMCGNAVTIINPYYVALGICDRLRDDTKFLRGNGYVLEQGFIQSASDAILSSGFNKAFSNDTYVAYSAQNIYLNDNMAFVEKPDGYGRYICTIRYNGTDFAVREYGELGFLYVDTRPDYTYPTKITVTTDDHNINYVMLKRNDFFLSNMRYLFERGAFRFKDMKCKEAILKALSY